MPLSNRALSLCIPGRGGLYSAFLALRQALAIRGTELTWAAAGRAVAAQAREAASACDLELGALVATDTDDELPRARALLDLIERRRFSVVVINVFGGPVETNLVRYLPHAIGRIMIVHNITLSTYRAAAAVRDWVDATVAVSPRIRRDLIWSHGFRPESVYVIPNAVATPGSAGSGRERAPRLRVLSHGRIERYAKGVHWLPAIVQGAIDAGIDLSLTVSGDGPDLPALRALIASGPLADRTRFLGFVERERVPELMRAHDVFLMPSIYEGFGLTLIEAMAAGCVPIASRIGGVTDWVVDEGRTGLLFPIGDVHAATARLLELGRNRFRLGSMSEAGISAVRTRFSVEAEGAAFFALMARIQRGPRSLRAALPVGSWRLPSGLKPGWWHALPAPLKGVLRGARERLQLRTA